VTGKDGIKMTQDPIAQVMILLASNVHLSRKIKCAQWMQHIDRASYYDANATTELYIWVNVYK